MKTAESVVVEFPAGETPKTQPQPKVREKLPRLEAIELKKQEHIIAEVGFPGMLKLADAFRVIRDKRLYRAEFDTFAEYCQKKWHREKATVNLLLQAGEVRDEMAKILATDESAKKMLEETSPHALRTLGKVEPEKREEVFKRAAEASNGAPTGEAVQEARAAVTEAELADMDRKEQQFAESVNERPKTKPRRKLTPNQEARIAHAMKERTKRRAADKAKANGKPPKAESKKADTLSEFDQWQDAQVKRWQREFGHRAWTAYNDRVFGILREVREWWAGRLGQ